MSQIVAEDVYQLTCPSSFANNLESELPSLLKAINCDINSGCFSQIGKFLFGQDSVLNHVSKCDLESKLLKPTLFSLSKIFSSSLSKTLSILENANDDEEDVCFALSEVLQICLDILDGYNDICVHLLNLTLLKPSEVESLIQTLPPLLLEAFNYCLGSENAFGSYFTLSTDLLTTIFRKSYEVISLFYKILDEHVDFNCSTEKDVLLLVTVLETLCSVGEVVVSLDLKSLVDQWKSIYKLITKYSSNLKDRLNISQPLNFLILHLKKTISSITNEEGEGNEQIRNRNLKLGSFILKIIVKLCELYCGYLDSCIKDLLDLLLILNRCSRQSKKSYNDELERFIVVGAGPLLAHLVQDRQFIEVFKNYCGDDDKHSVEDVIGLFFTHLRLLKFLINCNISEVKENWLRIPLVQSLIILFSKCCKHLDLTTTIEDNDTYSTLISVSVAYVISNLTPENFILLEGFLLTGIFKSELEVGLFCSDFLTLLCRLTNEEVCFQHTRYMFQALNLVDSRISRPEASLVRITASRLYSLLSKTGKEAIEKKFPPSSQAWRHVNFQSVEKLIPITPSFDSSDIDTPLEFTKKIETLHLICSSGINAIQDKDTVIDSVKRLLIGHKNFSKASDSQADWWYKSLYLLLKCFVYISPVIDSTYFEEILDVFLELTFTGQSPILYYVSTALANVFKSGSLAFNATCYISKIANIFQLCLACENVVIKQIVVENFLSIDYFKNGHTFVEIDKDSQEYIAAFTGKTLSTDPNIFYSYAVNFVHKCSKYDYNLEESPPNKKLKQDTDDRNTADVIIKLKESVEIVINYAKHNSLSLEDRKTVHSLICKLENV